MVHGVILVVLVLGAGVGVLRVLGLGGGGAAVGLAPAVGLAVLTVVAMWCSAIGLQPPVPGLVLLAVACAGVLAWLLGGQYRAAWATARCRYGEVAWLIAALAVPIIVMGVAFHGVEAPLSTHDGAFHVEAIDSLRRGQSLQGWYPPGLDASFAAILQLTPWRDSAAGSFEVALGLSVLAPLAVFGLASAVWREGTVAGVAALFASLTFLFAYFVHIWSGWPLQTAILMLIGAWILAHQYVEAPTRRISLAGGLLAGAIVSTHGSELISAALILPVVLLGNWRRIQLRGVLLDVVVIAAIAILCAAPYLPALMQWSGGGGATSAGYSEAAAIDVAAQTAAGGEPLRVFALDALGIDLPVRVVLALIGGWWIFRSRQGRSLIVVGLVFAALAVCFSFFSGFGVVRLLYALTYPWGLPYRLFQVDGVVIALVAAAGGVWSFRAVFTRQTARLLARATRVCIGAWLVVSASTLVLFVSIPTAEVTSFSADDEAAMAWMRDHVGASAAIVNDGYADAGIWIPYKTGLTIVLPRILPDAATARAQRDAIVDNAAKLDTVREAACPLQVGYVYFGAKNTGWQTRTFPPVKELLASPSLEKVYASGQATVFRVRIGCPKEAQGV